MGRVLLLPPDKDISYSGDNKDREGEICDEQKKVIALEAPAFQIDHSG